VKGPLRYVAFAVLVAAPVGLIGALVWQGRHAPPVVLPVASVSGHHPQENADEALLGFFKEPVTTPAGAKIKDKVSVYDEKGLFEYIDGAAPIFIERHFRKLAAADMVTLGDTHELTCDIYDMSAVENAKSIFEAEKSPVAVPVPDFADAVTGPLSFVFVSGRYYVKLTAFDKQAEAVLPKLAAALRARATK
jgi:hypothetical protein